MTKTALRIITPEEKERQEKAQRAFSAAFVAGLLDPSGRFNRVKPRTGDRPYDRAGAVIESLAPEVREDLKLLRSEDLADAKPYG